MAQQVSRFATIRNWFMQAGTDPSQAARYLGMSPEVLLNTYGHHHPEHMANAVEKIAKGLKRSFHWRNIGGGAAGALADITPVSSTSPVSASRDKHSLVLAFCPFLIV